MKLALRGKISIAFVALTAAVFACLDATLQYDVARSGERFMRDEMAVEARLLQRSLPAPPWEPSTRLQELVATLDRQAEARLTLIAPDGRVVADSRENPPAMENHADRPERLQAMREGLGHSVRQSETLGIDMLYLAVPVGKTGAGDAPVLRMARPMTVVRAASQQLRRLVMVTFVAATLLVWLLSLILAQNLTQPLQSILRVARRVGRGDLSVRVEGVEGPDLGELATVFNSALDELSRLLAHSQHESRYYAAILEQMTDAVIIVDRSGNVQFINPTFARVFGLQAEEVSGRTSEELALNYDLSALLTRALEQKAVQREEVRLLHPETRILATAVTPLLDDQEQVVGAIALLRDVTDLHRLDEVRREFVANASHELRTPAAAVKALAEALQIGALRDPEKGPRFVQQIVEAADRQTGILDDMLTLTRVERGRELLNVAPLLVSEVFEDAARQIRPAAEAKGVALRVESANGDQVMADAAGLRTVLLNLLENGVKYTPAEGTVSLRGRSVPGGYEITVSDTGIGIPAEHQSRIFERFYRVDKARDRATGGTGLGLSIVKHVVEAHGGQVSVQSTEGQGSTFTLLFPPTPPRS